MADGRTVVDFAPLGVCTPLGVFTLPEVLVQHGSVTGGRTFAALGSNLHIPRINGAGAVACYSAYTGRTGIVLGEEVARE